MQGTGYIYETLLRPFVVKHETDIDRKLLELRARAWDLAIYYWQNCTSLGQSAFFQVLDYLAAQSGKFSGTSAKVKNFLHKLDTKSQKIIPSLLEETQGKATKINTLKPICKLTTLISASNCLLYSIRNRLVGSLIKICLFPFAHNKIDPIFPLVFQAYKLHHSPASLFLNPQSVNYYN